MIGMLFWKLKGLWEIGGLMAMLLSVTDKISGKPVDQKYLYKIQKNASWGEYPRLLKGLYSVRTGKLLNLDAPQSFNEKIQWLKLYDNSPTKTELAAR